jgi:hypothetical protein
MTLSKAAQAARKAAKQQTQTYPIIGHTMWWTVRETEMTQAELEAAVDGTIGRSYMLDMPSTQRALRLALQSIEEAGIITHIPSDDDNMIAYTLHEEEIDRKNIDLELRKQQTIVYDKAAKKLTVRSEYKKKEIMDLVTKYQTIFTAQDIRSMMLKYLKSNGCVTMRDTGGIYFTAQTEVKDKLKAFVECTKGTFYSLGVPDADSDKATMHAVVKEELDRDLQLAAEDLKKLLEKEGDRTRSDSFETRIERFKTIRSKAELYKDLLRGDAEELEKVITELNDEVTKALMGEMTSHPQSKAYPYNAKVMYTGKAKDKYGETGVIVGYAPVNDHNAKVLFEKTQTVRTIAIEFLTVTK